ncbi:MAG TPA: YggS family pyridoxal phosphate-dependent enzyme [Desulfonatronum sp.]|nr:YggS family pyridoxal phosphate-dependent enzyme [Desulfonatronum sp.]
MSEEHDQALVLRWQETLQDVADRARRSGRAPADVQIIAVSKRQPLCAIRALAACGQLDFGENYVQEALEKQKGLALDAVQWHFLGRLQRNKAKFVPGRFVMLHSLDSLPLARVLQEKCETVGVVLDVLLQVNLGQEPQKGGVTEADLPEVARGVAEMSALSLRGLMALPPFELNLAHKQRAFARLARLRDRLQTGLGRSLDVLSMGTTDDYPQAIAEGATMVRIGTRIFGPRAC